MKLKFESFDHFYSYYLLQHQSKMNRFCHFVGTSATLMLMLLILLTEYWKLAWFLPVTGYGLAWFGHWVFEGNNPASFKYPLYSLRADIRMYLDMIKYQWPRNEID